VDHIDPPAVVPELDNVIANLELMPLRMRPLKSAGATGSFRIPAVKRLCVKQFCHHLTQILNAERFSQYGIDRIIAIAEPLEVGGYHHNRLRRKLVFDDDGELVAPESWHLKIRDHQIKPLALQQLERILSGPRLGHGVTVNCEQELDGLSNRIVILRDEDPLLNRRR
jgi:hypothetical protein